MLIYVERMINRENHCFIIITVIIDSDKNQQMPKLQDERPLGSRIFQFTGIIPQITY